MFYKVLLAVLGLCFAFEMKCPEPSQWSMRARLNCHNPALYCCLLSIDRNTTINVENCSFADFEAPGKRIVIRWNMDTIGCTDDKYQPIKYWTNVSSDCLFLTSKCSEEGQVLYGVHRYHQHDSSCACDHSKGYDFVTRPEKPCCCKPSKEDCSCYKNSSLSRDYVCTVETQKDVAEECTVSNITRAGTSKVIFSVLPEINKTDRGRKGNNRKTPFWVVVAVLVVIVMFTCKYA